MPEEKVFEWGKKEYLIHMIFVVTNLITVAVTLNFIQQYASQLNIIYTIDFLKGLLIIVVIIWLLLYSFISIVSYILLIDEFKPKKTGED